jgi:hypothetical protein
MSGRRLFRTPGNHSEPSTPGNLPSSSALSSLSTSKFCSFFAQALSLSNKNYRQRNSQLKPSHPWEDASPVVLTRNPTIFSSTDQTPIVKMDDLLPKLLAFPPHPPPQNPLSDSSYDDGIKAQISVVRKISEKSLLQQTSGGESPLNVS